MKAEEDVDTVSQDVDSISRDEDPDDEVLQELDVYINKSVSPNLHIFQYWSQNSPIADREDIDVKARPNHRIFEIETQMNTKSANFDKRKSETFANNLEANDKNEPKFDPSKKLLSKRVLKSVEMKPTLNQYCVAVIDNESSKPELHLNPIRSVIQFRQTLNYLNTKTTNITTKSAEVGPNKANHSSKGDESDAEASGQENGDIQAITMRFAGPDEDKLKKARERSFAYFQQNLEKDQWVDIKCHTVDSRMSADIKKNLVYKKNKTSNKRKACSE